MNAHVPIARSVEIEMSADGIITIPEDLRKVAGLIPGMRLMVGINDRGEVVLMTRTQFKRLGEDPDAREARLREAIAAMAGRYSTGQSTAEIMEELRGEPAS
jgi:bifunctional DNA-binding transcriptional regulator/antitoxin component of YhaV-PrlF toxin-antitoxin module